MTIYRILGIKKHPFITRMTVRLLGNNILYDTSKLNALEFKQRYTFEEAINPNESKIMIENCRLRLRKYILKPGKPGVIL